MKNVKTILCLISLLVAGITNVWGAVTCTLEDNSKTLKFTGTGSITSNSGWATSTNKSNVTKIMIGEGVTSIAANMFSDFTKVTQVNLPSSLISIGTDAFLNCSTIVKIYYADTPNKWASISIANDAAHPFKGGSASDHDFYFYGSEIATTNLVLTPPIKTIKQFAFYNSHFSAVNIPGTVTSIEEKALYCVISNRSAINCRTAPTLGSSAITSGTNFYIPTGASNYNVSPWSSHTTNQAVSGTISDTYGAGITWELDENGVLTLNATGANKEITFTGETAYNQYPWSNFRRLVHKVVLKGNISELSQTLTYLWGLSEITFDQTTIPEFTTDKAKIAYGSLFNTRDNVKLNIKAASLSDASASNLRDAPYDNDRLTIAISDDVIVADSVDNSTLLNNIHDYVDEPFNLQLNRSLSNSYLNTFCSPVEISDISGTFGAGTYLYEFAATEVKDDTLRLNFKDAASIVAGKPYLIKPKDPITNPRFTGITPSALATSGATVEGDDASFYGILNPLAITNEWAEGKNFIFLLADNKFTYATGGTLKGMRAYFLLDDDVEPGVLAHSPKMRINYEAEGGQTPTAIDKTQTEVKAEKVMENGVMYIIKNGVKYSVMGERVR